jgi:hypothetical protein
MNDDIEARKARHAEALRVIAEEGLEAFLSDPSNAVGGRFFILPDGRTFHRVAIEWEQIGATSDGNLTAWTPRQQGWELIPGGCLASDFPLELIWKSSKKAGGWNNGSLLSAAEKTLVRMAAGNRAVDRLEHSPPRHTIWDRWSEGG